MALRAAPDKSEMGAPVRIGPTSTVYDTAALPLSYRGNSLVRLFYQELREFGYDTSSEES